MEEATHPLTLISRLQDMASLPVFLRKKLSLLVGGSRVVDVLRHLPSAFQNRIFIPHLQKEYAGQKVSLLVQVQDHQMGRGRAPYKVIATDALGQVLTLVFFNARPAVVRKQFPVGQKLGLSGKLDVYVGLYQMPHPDWVGDPNGIALWSGVEAIYPLTVGITSSTLHRLLRGWMLLTSACPEWLPDALLEQHQWPSWHQALKELHFPTHQGNPQEPSRENKCRERLAFDELYAHQLSLLLLKQSRVQERVPSLALSPQHISKIQDVFPFILTPGQQQALKDIMEDLASGHRMMRLVQGDVGSGKTLVAFGAMAAVGLCGHQGALLVPTEILARQHAATLTPLVHQLGLSLELLISDTKNSEKKRIKKALGEGQLSLIVGTHALLEDDVVFQSLRLAVIDEQHRFGVRQRQALVEKSPYTHVLLMTATPIPRTLLLSQHGDIDVSQIKEKPGARRDVQTRLLSLDRLGDVIERLESALQQGEKAYWVCPLIHASEGNDSEDMAAALSRYQSLQSILGTQVGLLHGKLPSEEKDALITAFHLGTIRCLVATTVIEVGVDVSDATIMIIEQAERFGLAQLHQLRGRVGRGEKPGVCLLLHPSSLSPMAYDRLRILRDTHDGFAISEKDLILRGAGEMLGTRQSGLAQFRNVDPEQHFGLLELAHSAAAHLLSKDPQLKDTKEGQGAQQLLRLYGQDNDISL